MHKSRLAIILMAIFLSFNTPLAIPDDIDTQELNKKLNDTFKSLDMLKESQKHITRDLIKEQLEAKPAIKKITDKFPKIIDFITNVAKDEKVMPELVKMMKRKKDLLNFFYANVVLFIISFLWKLKYRKKDFFSISYLSNMFIKFFTINGLRLIILIYLFGNNLSPLWRVFKDTFEVF